MATTSIIQAGGGDYTSIVAWEAAETAANDIGEIQDSATYTGNVVISGGGGGRKVTVSLANRHDFARSGAVVNPTASGHAFDLNEAGTTVEYIRITGLVGISSECFRCSDDCTIRYVFCHDFGITQQDGVYMTAGVTVTVLGSAFVNVARAGIWNQAFTGAQCNVHNCVVINHSEIDTTSVGIGFEGTGSRDFTGSEFLIKNSVATNVSSVPDFHQATDDFGAYSTGTDFNASSDTTAPDTAGSNKIHSITPADEFVSVVSSSEDPHLKVGNILEDAGVDDTGVLTVDAEGSTFTVGNWEMGIEANRGAGAVGGVFESRTSLGISIGIHGFLLMLGQTLLEWW